MSSQFADDDIARLQSRFASSLAQAREVSDKPMPFSQRWVKLIAGAIADSVNMVNAKHASRMEKLETRIAALENKEPTLKYCGVWEEHRLYVRGNFCTDHGSIWHCERSTRARPNTNDDWVLAVKRGKDA